MKVVDYHNIEDVLLNLANEWKTWANASDIPGINVPKIDWKTSIYNMPDIDVESDLVWWDTNIVWNADTYRKVSWTAGTIYLQDWTTFVINSWDTGNISVITYIYADIDTANPVLITTTIPQDAVGAGKLLLCVAKPVTNTKGKAIFQPFWTVGGEVFITADNIAANTITANEIASNTITATQMNVSKLSAISANLWTITAGTITGATIRTASSGARVQLDTRYFRWYDTNYERIRIQNDRIVFWDSSGDEAGQLVAWNLLWNPMLVLDKPLGITATLLCRWVRCTSNATYDIWLSSYQRRDLYLSRDIYINWYVLDESGGHLRWKWYWIPYTIAVATATQTPNTLIRVRINWSDYNLSARAI